MYKIHKNDLDIRMKKIVFLNATFEDNAHEIIDTSIIYCASNIFEEVKVRFLNDRSQIIEKEIADNFSCDNIYFRPFHNIKKKVNGFSGLGNNIVSRTINKLRIVLREIISFMDKLAGVAGSALIHKPAAAVASARRAGTTATLDVLNKYFAYHQMPIVSSNYWNVVHGNTPDEVKQDAEGMQIMRVLGRNMAWLLKCIEAGKTAGITAPETEAKVMTNFIR